MVIGLLWYDADKNTDLTQKILRAAEHYRYKYGMFPNICFVNPKMIQTGFKPLKELAVQADARVLPNHFWLGFQSEADKT